MNMLKLPLPINKYIHPASKRPYIFLKKKLKKEKAENITALYHHNKGNRRRKYPFLAFSRWQCNRYDHHFVVKGICF
jgi:hypothetical protein